MKHLKTFENYLTKKYQRKKDYNEYLYDNGFGDRYYICSKCDSYKLTPIPSGGFSPPEWHCDNCGEINYGPSSMHPEKYKDYIERKEIKKSTNKFNL